MAESMVVQEGKTLKELEKEITCSVCQEQYTEPKVLPCLHYYCKECVLKLAFRTASNKFFSCPECRKKTTLPKGGVEELKTAFFINRLKSHFSVLERVHSKIEVTCEGCNSRSKAGAFCRHCAVFICKDCVASHKKLRVFSSHEVASLEDLKQGRAKQIAVAEPATKKCTIHEEPLLIYCFDCDSLICRDCTVIDHKEHKFQFSKVAAPEIKKSLLEELVSLKGITAKLSGTINEVHVTKDAVEAQGKSVVNTIETSFEELHDILEKQKNELIQEALRRVEDKMVELSVQEKNLSVINAEVHSIVEYTERLVGHCSDNEVMSMHADIRRQIQKEIKEHGKSGRRFGPVQEADMGVELKCGEVILQLCQTKTKIIQLAIDPAQCTVRGEGAEIAEVHQPAQVTLTTRLSNNKTTSRSTVVVSKLKSLYDGSVIKCNVDQSGPGDYCIQYTPTVRGRHELTVSVDGKQVAGSPFPVFVSISPTQLGKPVKVWHQNIGPRGIAANSKNEVIATEGCEDIVKFDTKGKRTVLIKHSQSKLAVSAVAVDDEDNIYCADYGSDMIIKCDNYGCNAQIYRVQQVAGPGHCGLTIVGDEVMLCERNNEGSIMIYDKEFKYERCIERDNWGLFRDLSADSHGNLYIVNCDCIQVFSNEGVSLYSFRSDSNGIKRIHDPTSVCVSRHYVYVTNCCEFYVANSRGSYVSVFTTAGDYVTSFGQMGQKEGDMQNPQSLCVDKNGFIYVADCWNHRVQSF